MLERISKRSWLMVSITFVLVVLLMLLAANPTWAQGRRRRNNNNNNNAAQADTEQSGRRNGRDGRGNRGNNNNDNDNDNDDDVEDTDNDVVDDIDIDDIDVEPFLNVRSLDGSGNNLLDETLGMGGLPYGRVAAPVYADGVDEMALEVDPRFVSNRIYSDRAVNLFSENGVTHWGFVWGQFVDHSLGFRQQSEDETTMMFPFDEDDPLEEFTNDLGGLSFTRSVAAPGTGVTTPREQINTLSSYLDASAVYGTTADRLDWLRAGSLDGNPNNNDAELLMTADGYLPPVTTRGDASNAPAMNVMGALRLNPTDVVVAGDVRANENLGLTAVQTLFAREHNRIVDELPSDLSENVKFEIARRVVGATKQYITYEEFLPAHGVDLPRYTGYDPTVDPTVTNEFSTVGYRAHSMIHGEFELIGDRDDFTRAELNRLEDENVEVDVDGDEVEFVLPLNIAFGRPHLLPMVGLEAALIGFSAEAQYANDVMIDNQLRSVLFQIPAPGATNPAACLDGEDLPDCFTGVTDLGALDLLRAYDHGIPEYNDLREAYGLERVSSFTEMTGESTEQFPNSTQINAADPINDPDILDFIAFLDEDGDRVDENDDPVAAVQRTTVAARLAAIYDDVDNVDAFTGMMAEPHVSGTEFGELQLAMWTKQFTDIRDGDRFFHRNDPILQTIRQAFGIDYRQTLADVIANNTDLDDNDVPNNVFVTND